ncbi:hypothetical protein EDC45_1320 [Mesocricetibacter intestinalis]|uniref:Lipoprotein n=1 Tax=Mesocricetibacter intestinalis TaxID=1521930 RepID=A0A4R6VB60_9PAST|nr:hypothetical protein [Mesocricetibacter intestinalis]TDQ57673.1 hypothetical protein EDC45_1320 [Mesocricetibacter intestinalis]
MLKKFGLLLLVLTLSACSSGLKVVELPLQDRASRLFKVEAYHHNLVVQTSLLAVEYRPAQWRWVQSNLIGAPLARAILSPQGWRNDGFIMPNKQAIALFSALASGLNPQHPPFAFSSVQETAQGRIYRVQNRELWRVSHQQGIFYIDLADGSRWRITEIDQEE